ncbi:apolipoprotein N-acyltransferase [Flaviaesturariibacter terrae]
MCNVVAVARVQYVPALFSVACVAYLVLQATNLRQVLWTGIGYMTGVAMLLNYWMLPALLQYTGGNWLMAIGCYVASWTLMAPFFALQFVLFALLRNRGQGTAIHWRNGALFAAVWVLFEWGRAWLFSAVPFLAYSWGSALGQNILLVQPAATGGVFALTFLLVFPAYLLAVAWYTRRWRSMVAAPAILLLQLAAGWWMLRGAEDKAAGRPLVDVALVQPALSTDLSWDPQNGNRLVQHLLALNRQAAALHPDLAAWTETTVPWSYRPDDDFIGELTKAMRAGGAARSYTLLGMSSDGSASDTLPGNSLYLLAPSGSLLGRYDKQELLAGAERPFIGGFVLPFQTGSGTRFRAGAGRPVASPWGKAGLLLCNEAAIPAPARDRAADSAAWMAVLGNDAWFADSYVPYGHFNQCRIRAVENRKDVLVNINMGDGGIIRASGDIAARFDGRAPAVHAATLQPNTDAPPSHRYFAVFIGILLLTCNRILLFRKPNPQNKHS